MPRPLDRLAAGPVFVVGTPRSGTTWVYDILTAHPEVAGVYESFLFTTHDGFGALFSEVQWRDRGAERFGLGQLVGREELVDEVRRLAETWLARAIGPDQRFLVEKSPSHLEVVDLICELLPSARFVFLRRDGRDVIVSQRAAARSWAKEWQRRRRIPMPVSLPPLRAAAAWRAAIDTGRRHAARLGPDRWLEVAYEDLKADPVGGIRRLYEWCGFPADDGVVADAHERTDFARNYSGGEDQFRRGGRVGDWRTRFSKLDAVAYEIGSGGELVRCGYERSRLWWLGAGRSAPQIEPGGSPGEAKAIRDGGTG